MPTSPAPGDLGSAGFVLLPPVSESRQRAGVGVRTLAEKQNILFLCLFLSPLADLRVSKKGKHLT